MIGFLYQVVGFDPQKRRKLKNDLDILDKLQEHNFEEEYFRVKEYIKSRVIHIYRTPKETDTIVRIPDLKRLIFGIFLILFFSGITIYYYITESGFQWWMVITILFIISGLGNLLQGIMGENKK